MTSVPPIPGVAPGRSPAAPARGDDEPLVAALLGNPNTGKTTLFNRLTGLRHKTGNFPGTTLEARIGRLDVPGGDDASWLELIDLPGIYSLELDQLEAEICRAVLAGRVAPRGQIVAEPSAICVVADATNLPRSLMLVGEALRRRLPTIFAVNMIDLARTRGVHIDVEALSRELGCRVLAISARTGEGVDALRAALGSASISNQSPPGDEAGLRDWAETIYARVASAPEGAGEHESFTDRLDRAFTHPAGGLAIFAALMAGMFYLLFTIAKVPMDLIDHAFAWVSGTVKAAMPPGLLSELLTEGVITGVGATLIFLPQICLLFFVIAILEDTGYLARAAFVADRLLRPFGLPGHSFMPLLSSHACALPGIMATRTIPDRRERLATILVAPFMSCSARLPVYALLTTVLFRDRPFLAALAFVGCYALGILAGIVSALVARRTILRGKSRPMALELPSYKRPSLRTALLTTYDRGLVFVKNAGTNILMICIVLWWLSAYPHATPPAEAVALREQAAALVASAPASSASAESPAAPARAEELVKEAEHLEARHQQAQSFAGQLGRFIQPVLAPIGADWQLSVGIVTSFAAREVFVSTMAVVVAGEKDAEAEGVLDTLAAARRDDGSPVFTLAACWALLVYYVLAMQCLPTLAVTTREAGSVKWAALQLVWMSGLAFTFAAIVYQILSRVPQ